LNNQREFLGIVRECRNNKDYAGKKFVHKGKVLPITCHEGTEEE
jgi:hypothetical protein